MEFNYGNGWLMKDFQAKHKIDQSMGISVGLRYNFQKH